jgi:hypothetical protein
VEVSLPPEHATATRPAASTTASSRRWERFIGPMLRSRRSRPLGPRTTSARWGSLPA